MSTKRGQVTIFVIVGLLVVVAILVFFVWVQPSLDLRTTGSLGFEGCVEDAVATQAITLAKSAGIENGFTYQYQGNAVPYVCYTNNFYETCVVQQPFLKQNFEATLKKRVADQVQSCYDSDIGSLQAQGYEVQSGVLSFDVLLEPGLIQVPIQAPTTVESRSFTKLNVEIVSPVYDMVLIATSIIQQEARLGDANTDILMANNPDYTIKKLKRDEGTTIYTIQSKLQGDTMQFASRSLPWPAGFDTQ